MYFNNLVRSKNKILIPVAFSNTLEWYDFFLFAYFAPIFRSLFFPNENTTFSLISVFLVFSMGFITRPLGSIIFGHLGDRFGRKNTLASSITLMGIGTVAIGCLPTYNQIGILAPILLMICRLLQGISLGGENTGNAVYIVEQSPQGKRGLFVSFSIFGTFLGAVLASAISGVLSNLAGTQQLIAWAWRIPFLLGIFSAGIGLYFRLKMPESPLFINLENRHDIVTRPIITALKEKPLTIFKIFLLLSSSAPIYFMAFIFLPTYANIYLKLSLTQVLLATSINNLIGLVLVIPVGYLSDNLGRKKIITFAFISLAIVSYPLFLVLSQGIFWAFWFAQFIFHIVFVLSYTTIMVLMCESFQAKIRFSAAAIANGFSSIIASLTPLVATSLVGFSGSLLAPSYLLIFFGVVGFVSSLTTQETYKTNI